MYKILINIASFLIGYLIFLTIYNSYKNIEKFENIKIKNMKEKEESDKIKQEDYKIKEESDKIKEDDDKIKEDDDEKIEDEISSKEENSSISSLSNQLIKTIQKFNNFETETDKDNTLKFPNKNNLLMLLSSYNNNVVNEKLKWYSENKDKDDEILNKGSYFTINKIIQFVPFALNDKILGANINNTILSGPNSDYFSNNMYSKNDLTHFSILFMIKINKLSDTNTLFEMICNTTTKYDEDKEEEIYVPNSVYIKLNRVKDDIYNIIINIGSKKYVIDDINDNIFNNDISFMSLKLNKDKITFILNNNIYNFDYETTDELITSNQPIIINKNGNIDALLYNFAYYKDNVSNQDINDFKKYVNYYIYGLNYEKDNKNNIIKEYNILKEKHLDTLSYNQKLIDNLQKVLK